MSSGHNASDSVKEGLSDLRWIEGQDLPILLTRRTWLSDVQVNGWRGVIPGFFKLQWLLMMAGPTSSLMVFLHTLEHNVSMSGMTVNHKQLLTVRREEMYRVTRYSNCHT